MKQFAIFGIFAVLWSFSANANPYNKPFPSAGSTVRGGIIASALGEACKPMGNFRDISGQKFGRLTAKSRIGGTHTKKCKWVCVCECGNEKEVLLDSLTRGLTRSCGCLFVENIGKAARKHGLSKHPLHSVWYGIKRRCYEKKHIQYHNYGKRGIKMCEEWRVSPVEFIKWSRGKYAKGLQIDRINNDGDYEPSNCRWVTNTVNANNRRGNVRIAMLGEEKTLAQWSRDPRCAVTPTTFKSRVRIHAWDPQKALLTPKCR